MNLLDGRISATGHHFELESGMMLPLGKDYSRHIGRNMTLGIRPEHIALSSQAEGGVPQVLDTTEMLGADNGPRALGRAETGGAAGASASPDGRQHAVAASARKPYASL